MKITITNSCQEFRWKHLCDEYNITVSKLDGRTGPQEAHAVVMAYATIHQEQHDRECDCDQCAYKRAANTRNQQ